jgi:hypothetical protein
MSLKSDSTLGLPLLADGTFEVTDAAIEQQVLALFDTTAPSLLRYVQTFGLSADETEDVVQEAFLSLFYHLRIGRPRTNLRGWLFKVSHNLALKQRRRRKQRGGLGDIEQIERDARRARPPIALGVPCALGPRPAMRVSEGRGSSLSRHRRRARNVARWSCQIARSLDDPFGERGSKVIPCGPTGTCRTGR